MFTFMIPIGSLHGVVNCLKSELFCNMINRNLHPEHDLNLSYWQLLGHMYAEKVTSLLRHKIVTCIVMLICIAISSGG